MREYMDKTLSIDLNVIASCRERRRKKKRLKKKALSLLDDLFIPRVSLTVDLQPRSPRALLASLELHDIWEFQGCRRSGRCPPEKDPDPDPLDASVRGTLRGSQQYRPLTGNNNLLRDVKGLESVCDVCCHYPIS